MKKISLLLLLSVFLFSCKKEKVEKPELKSDEIAVVDNSTTTSELPVKTEEETSTESEQSAIKEEEKVEEKKSATKEKVVVKQATSANSNNNLNRVKETVQEKVVEETNTVVEEVIEKPKEIVEEKVEEVKEVVETVVEEVVEKPKPVKPVVQELTLAQKIAKGKKLFNTGICTTCHDPKKKKIGPTLKEISKIYRKKHASIAKFLKGNAKPLVWPKKFMMMKPNIDDVTSKMSKGDLEALDAYILSVK